MKKIYCDICEKVTTDDLLRILEVKRRIDSKTEMLDNFQEVIKSADKLLPDSKTGKNYRQSKVEQDILSLMNTEESIIADKKELLELSGKVMAAINQIKNTNYQELLVYKFVFGYKWSVIAQKMNYSYVHVVHRLYPKALEEFRKISNQ